MNDYRTVDQELIAFMASLLQDPDIARRAWPASDTSVKFEDAIKADEHMSSLLHEAFDADHDSWVKWSEATQDLSYAYNILGFIQGCKFAADILLPLAAPDATGYYPTATTTEED